MFNIIEKLIPKPDKVVELNSTTLSSLGINNKKLLVEGKKEIENYNYKYFYYSDIKIFEIYNLNGNKNQVYLAYVDNKIIKINKLSELNELILLSNIEVKSTFEDDKTLIKKKTEINGLKFYRSKVNKKDYLLILKQIHILVYEFITESQLLLVNEIYRTLTEKYYYGEFTYFDNFDALSNKNIDIAIFTYSFRYGLCGNEPLTHKWNAFYLLKNKEIPNKFSKNDNDNDDYLYKKILINKWQNEKNNKTFLIFMSNSYYDSKVEIIDIENIFNFSEINAIENEKIKQHDFIYNNNNSLNKNKIENYYDFFLTFDEKKKNEIFFYYDDIMGGLPKVSSFVYRKNDNNYYLFLWISLKGKIIDLENKQIVLNIEYKIEIEKINLFQNYLILQSFELDPIFYDIEKDKFAFTIKDKLGREIKPYNYNKKKSIIFSGFDDKSIYIFY